MSLEHRIQDVCVNLAVEQRRYGVAPEREPGRTDAPNINVTLVYEVVDEESDVSRSLLRERESFDEVLIVVAVTGVIDRSYEESRIVERFCEPV